MKMKKLPKIFRVFLILLCALPVFSLEASAYLQAGGVPDTGYARYIYLYHIESGTVLYEKSCDTEIPPASTVKLMTALVAMDYLASSMTRVITVSEKAISNISGNNINLQAGEQLTVEDLFYALIVGGANDAAFVLAEECCGSTEAFVVKMNEKAAELGCENTVYLNPTGLDATGMHTTARDTAKVALSFSQSVKLLEISGADEYLLAATNLSRQRRIFNKNYFLCDVVKDDYLRSDIRGLNAGSTPNAGACVTALADNGTYTYLCVVMGASVDADTIWSYDICGRLLDWAYESYGYATVVGGSDIICEVPVKLGDGADHVLLLPGHEVTMFVPVDFDPENDVDKIWRLDQSSVNEDGSLTAPIEEGMTVGALLVYKDGELLANVPLVTKNHVDRSEWSYRWGQIAAIVETRAFAIGAAAVLAAIAVFIFAVAYIRGQKLKNRKKK